MNSFRASVQSIGLIIKEGNDKAMAVGEEIADWLAARSALRFVANHLQTPNDVRTLPPTDLVFILGGDGTIIAVGRQFLGSNIPLAGINFGRVGFLAEVDPEHWKETLLRVLSSPVPIVPRMSLHYAVYRDKELLVQGEVINDVVITRGNLARLVRLELAIENEHFFTLRADGIIFSTPTGSTGYSGSAGGPLMIPTLNSYIVTAICPFLSTFPPFVIPAETPLRVTVCESGAEVCLTLDGQIVHNLAPGDEVVLHGIPHRFLMAQLHPDPYVKRLQQAGFISQSKK